MNTIHVFFFFFIITYKNIFCCLQIYKPFIKYFKIKFYKVSLAQTQFGRSQKTVMNKKVIKEKDCEIDCVVSFIAKFNKFKYQNVSLCNCCIAVNQRIQ